MRRVKLTTGWATWWSESTHVDLPRYRLRSESGDFCASIGKISPLGAWYGGVYTTATLSSAGWEYDNRESLTLDADATDRDAVATCEQRLIACGLIDLIWWVTQCPEE